MVDMNKLATMQLQNNVKNEAAPLPKMSSDQTANGTPPSAFSRLNNCLNNFLFTEISIAPLVYYRIIFGGIMLYEVCTYFNSGWIPYYYINPKIYFKYFGWEWMPGPLPGKLMYLFYVAMAIIYFCFTIGLWYRVMSIAAFLGFFYWFNLDVTQHLNHFYLIALMSFLNMFLPLHRNTSLDAICRPELRVSKVPAWTLWVLVFQISMPYFFGGMAKLNSDWLQGEPVRTFLYEGFPEGHFFTTAWWAPYFFAWGGLVYDITVVPTLLWKKTRTVAVAGTAFFHLFNDTMFTIGIFPWFMLASTPLYFEPDLLNFIFQAEWLFARPQPTKATLSTPPHRRSLVKVLFCMFVAYNCFMPFRHFLYPGEVGWTEEGHYYSWHMKLQRKSGAAKFTVKFADGTQRAIKNKSYLTERQNNRMRPLAILQFAHFLCDEIGEEAEKDGKAPIEVYVENQVSMNGRRAQYLVDPTVDLCKAKMGWGPADWIVPLKVPLWDQSMNTLMTRIAYHDGKTYVDDRVVKRVSGNDGVRFGTVTGYNHTYSVWTARFDDQNQDEVFNIQDFARSKWLQAQYEHSME